jgi:hypothetical protein
MRAIAIVLLLLAGLASSLAPAGAHADEPDEAQLSEHGHYVNRSGQNVHAPAHTRNGQPPSGATARCRDGSYSFSKHRSGTCSGHHGVADWL